MCTASWLSEAGTLRLLFNRDELRSREPALPPAAFGTDGARWLAPRDGRAGGTWIAAGERGVVLALLNRSDGARPENAASRGLLIPKLLPAPDPGSLLGGLARHDLTPFAPFRLLALWRHLAHGIVAGWDGATLGVGELASDRGLLCSSSLGDDRATAMRGRAWSRWLADAERSVDRHRAFHADHEPAPSAWSVCMHRDDARSVSLTAIEMTPDEIRLAYHDAPPCEPGAWHELSLPAAGRSPG